MASPRRLRAGSPTPLGCASILRILSSPAPCLLMPEPYSCPEDDLQERKPRLTRLYTSGLARCDLSTHDVPLRPFCSDRLSTAGPGHIAGRRPFFSALPHLRLKATLVRRPPARGKAQAFGPTAPRYISPKGMASALVRACFNASC